MSTRTVQNWPKHIDQKKFLKECKKYSVNQLAKRWEIPISAVDKYKKWLRANGLLEPLAYVYQQETKINSKNQEAFIRDSFLLTSAQMCEKYNVSFTTFRETKRRLIKQGFVLGCGGFPKPLGRSFNDQLRLEIQRFICIGDSEIPDHDPEWFELVIALAEAWNIKDLIINGDFVALDSLSSWMRQLARHQTFDDELKAASEALTAFSNTFDNIYYLQANHERRLAHAIEGQMSFGDRLKDKLQNLYGMTISDYPYCWVNSNGEEYLICHPDNYSRIPLSVPLALSNINHKHLIVGHTHRLAEGRSKSGDYRIIEGGHMRDLEKTAYKTLRINTHPAWNPGFVVVIDGLPWILDKEKALFFIDGFQKALGGK